MKEIITRSMLKSLIWRITGIIILAVITFVYTRNWITTGLVTFLHHGVFLIVFYIHERIWLKTEIKSMLKKSILKMLTYETLCGNIILGIITYLVTGSWQQMTAITLSYIGTKHIIYIWNEFIWNKIYWGVLNGKENKGI